MKFRLVLFLALLSDIVCAQPIPIEEFARNPDFRQMRLSPDGRFVAFLREVGGKTALFFLNLERMQPARVEPGTFPMSGEPIGVFDVRWISDTRVLYNNTIWDEFWVGTSGVNRDGTRAKPLTGPLIAPLDRNPLIARQLVHVFHDARNTVLLLDEGRRELGIAPRPDVIKLDTLTGAHEVVVKNPGNVLGWETDFHGNVRVGVTVDGKGRGLIYREHVRADWRKLPIPDERGDVRPLVVNDDGTADMVALTDNGFWTAFRYDVAKGTFSAPLAEEPGYDMLARHGDFAWPVYSLRKRALVGIHYEIDGPRTRWLDPEFAAIQATVDASLRGTVNRLVSFTRDDKQALVLAFSDKDPGSYYVYNSEKRQMRFLAKRMSRIKPEQLSDMYPIKYNARDGLTIRGYLTVPKERKPEGLPLIVMPHGGPWARDVWEFDPLVQMLASRGYAVLQMNFRGSLGYGAEFAEKGRREFGGAVQRDIEDATRWAIAQGIADPKRVAIVGGSFGGYCALYAVGRTPDLYRCGIAMAAVTDWAEIIKRSDTEEYRLAHEHWVEQLGDPKLDREALDAISPVNFAREIKAPVLLIHGRDDRTVPIRQARKMVSALEAAGRPPEALFFTGEGHGTTNEKNRIEEFRRIEAFLAQHMK